MSHTCQHRLSVIHSLLHSLVNKKVWEKKVWELCKSLKEKTLILAVIRSVDTDTVTEITIAKQRYFHWKEV